MARTKKEENKEVDVRKERIEKKRKEALRKGEVIKKINACSRDLTVEVMSNVKNFIYKCPSTDVVLEINGFGNTDVMTYEVFKAMCNRKKRILEQYWIIPIAVYGNDEITLDDVMEVLKIDNLFEEDMFFEDNIDDILLNCNAKQLSGFLNAYNSRYKELIINRAVELARQDLLSDGTKRKVLIKENPKLKEIFDDIDEELMENI